MNSSVRESSNRCARDCQSRHLSECEGEGFGSRIEKLDRESPFADGPFLSNELIEALLLHNAGSVLSDIDAAVRARLLSLQRDAVADGFTGR